MIHTEMFSKEDFPSNLIVVAATNDDNLNTKIQFEYEGSIWDLDGIQLDLSHVKWSNDDDEYFQEDHNNPVTNNMVENLEDD